MDLNKIQKMVKKAQEPLKLASYRIRSQIEDVDDSDYAEIFYDHSKRTARIVFSRRKINKELEDTIVHELLHLFLSKHLGVAENVFERQKKRSSLKKYKKGEERAIIILAHLLEKAIFGR